MIELASHLFAQVDAAVSGVSSPVNILFGAVASLTTALIALYKDCRADRAKLWDHVRHLEDKLGIRLPAKK